MIDKEKIKEHILLKKSDELFNVNNDLIDLYIEDNIEYVKMELNIDVTSEDEKTINFNRLITQCVLYDLGLRGVEGAKNYNEGGQSMSFRDKRDVIKEAQRYRRPL